VFVLNDITQLADVFQSMFGTIGFANFLHRQQTTAKIDKTAQLRVQILQAGKCTSTLTSQFKYNASAYNMYHLFYYYPTV